MRKERTGKLVLSIETLRILDDPKLRQVAAALEGTGLTCIGSCTCNTTALGCAMDDPP